MTSAPALPTYSAAELAAMRPKQLVATLVRDEDRAPRELIEECARRGDALLDRLESLVEGNEPWDDLSSGAWWLRVHAANILGLMSSARAGELLVALMHRMGDEGDSNMQDWLAGWWPALFRNKPAEVVPALRALAEEEMHDWYIRCQGVEAVLEHERLGSGEAYDAAMDWAAAIVGDEEEDWDMRCVTAGALLDHAPPQYRPLLESLARRQPDTFMAHFHLDDVTRAYDAGVGSDVRQRFSDPWAHFYSPDEIAKRQVRWTKEDEERVARERTTPAETDASAGAGDDELAWDQAYDADQTGTEPARAAPSVGRNDPCPCGSGKKYKKCCLAKDTALPADELVWRRLRSVLDENRPAVMRFAIRAYGDSALDEAWDEFSAGELGEFDDQGPHAQAFVPWFYNFWSPAGERSVTSDTTLHGVVPAAAYLQRAKRVDPLFREYVESCLATSFTVFEVYGATPGVGLRMQDLFTGVSHDVSERTASRVLRAGSLAAGQLGHAGGVTIVEAISGFVIPQIQKLAVLETRQNLFPAGAPDAAALRARHKDVVALYRRIARAVLHPRMPEMMNSDGEPLSPRRVIFDVPSAKEAFEALKHLGSIEDEDELFRAAERDASGTLRAVRFSWLKSGPSRANGMDNTVLGWLDIREKRMMAHVNSEAREERIRAIVADALGDRARYRVTEIESLERAWNDARTEGEPSAARLRIEREAERLAAMPEVAKAIMEILVKQYEKWPDERLPALGDRTPREAVRDAIGREAVAVLIAEIEQNGARQKPPLDPTIVRKMREELGLVRAP